MSIEIVGQDIAALLDGWIEAEQNGGQFPVPFDLAWEIAGYSTKGNAKRKLTSKKTRLVEGRDYLIRSDKSSLSGRSGDLIELTCDAFKSFCLLAETEEGDLTRSYFIDAEKKWKLVQKVAPQLAQEIELMKLKVELASVETQKTNAESQKAIAECQKAIAEAQRESFRHLVINTMPEVNQQKILGYELVEKIEYRDRVIVNGEVVNDGSTLNKTELCDRYNIKTRNGSPDFKRLNALLEGAKLPPAAWEETTTIRSNMQLRRDWLDNLDRHILGTTRQLHVGE